MDVNTLQPGLQHRIYNTATSRCDQNYFNIVATDKHIMPHARFRFEMVPQRPELTFID